MKVFVIGDPHFKGEEKIRGGNKLSTDKMCLAILHKIKEIKPDIVVILGDILDRFARIHTIALTDAINWIYNISDLTEKVYVLIGNHDRPANDDYMSEYHPFSGIRNQEKIKIIYKTLSVYFQNIKSEFLFVPYVPPGKFHEAISQYDVSIIKCIFAHQEFLGCKYNNIESKIGDKWPKEYPLVISGHIHEYQKIQDNIIYVGTPMQQDFGDLTKKTVSVFTFYLNNNINESRISLDLPERKVLTLDVKEVQHWKYDSNYIWKLIIIDIDSEITIFLNSNKYKKLLDLGITISTRIKDIVNSDTNNNDNTPNLEILDFKKSLIKRVEKYPEQLKWLEIILNNM